MEKIKAEIVAKRKVKIKMRPAGRQAPLKLNNDEMPVTTNKKQLTTN